MTGNNKPINIPSSIKYRFMFVVGGIVHLSFLFIFLSMRIMPLVYINILSVLTYIIGAICSVNNKGVMNYGWVIVFYSEILLHSFVCTLLLGNNVSFHLYILITIPMAVYVLFFTCTVERFLITFSAMVVCSSAAVASSFIMLHELPMFPYFPLTYNETEFLRMINLIFVAFMLVAFSLLFAVEIYCLVQSLNDTNRRLEYTATHDELTGLYNRRSIKPIFDKLETGCEPCCIALGDIDDFKKVNDTYGHDAGDLVLKTVSSIITGGIQWDDIACRWGGEEILVILHGSAEECYSRLEKIHQDIRDERVSSDSDLINVTMTFGFCEITGFDDRDALISAVDKKLYYGKKNGKNQIVK
ncbi:MAG: GGDEF domain-containing protein [Oscillospiraceae bacterium]